jgi:hypothetical protein
MAVENPDFVHQINGQFYHVQIWLHNDLEEYKPFLIHFSYIQELIIEESLVDWPSRGSITLINDFEVFERGALSTNSKNKTNNGGTVKAPYVFRTDGRNKLGIKIYPIKGDPFNTGVPDIGDDLTPALWEISLDGAIYDIEDLPTKNNHQKKLRKLYFHDERNQILNERNLEWSTSKYGPNQGQIGTTDIQRTMPANMAIQSILHAAGSNSSNPLIPDLMVGYDYDGSIDKPNVKFANIDNNNWDTGPSSPQIDDGGCNVFYTSPAHHCANDDIAYMMNNAVGQDGSPVFLSFGRWSGDKTWKLISLGKYFQKASENQIEKLILEDGMDGSTTPPYIARAPNDVGTDIKNFQSGIASRIRKYFFAQMSPEDDARIKNTPIYNYNFANSEFNIIFSGKSDSMNLPNNNGNTAEGVFQNLNNLAKSGLYGYQQPGSGQILLNLNQTKQKGLMTTPYFEPQTFFPKMKTGLQMTSDSIFLNQALHFRAPGLTFRSPGKFVFVDRTTSSDNNPFDDRFCGQWLIHKVTHRFTQVSYHTDVVCNKIDAFSQIFNSFGLKF